MHFADCRTNELEFRISANCKKIFNQRHLIVIIIILIITISEPWLTTLIYRQWTIFSSISCWPWWAIWRTLL